MKLLHIVVDLLLRACDPVLDSGKPCVEAGFGAINPFLQSLERARDGNGEVIRALVDDALDTFDVVCV